jgi:hypothetical protein
MSLRTLPAASPPGVLRRMACSFSVQVFAKAHVEHPMQFVFDAPVLANHAVQSRRIPVPFYARIA